MSAPALLFPSPCGESREGGRKRATDNPLNANHPLRGALAFRRFAAALPSGGVAAIWPQTPGRASWDGACPRRWPRSPSSSTASSSQAGLYAGRAVSGLPGSGVQIRARGPHPAPLSGVPSRRRPSMSEMILRNIICDKCQGIITFSDTSAGMRLFHTRRTSALLPNSLSARRKFNGPINHIASSDAPQAL